MKKYNLTITEMKDICKKNGSYYFAADTVRFWKSKVHSAPNRWGLFIQSHRSFDDKKRLYCVKSFFNGEIETIEPREIGVTSEHFSTLAEARAFREKLSKALDAACSCYREKSVLGDIVDMRETGYNSGVYTLVNGNGESIEINTNNFDRFICG